jgi:AcrR family transcriptional regulator
VANNSKKVAKKTTAGLTKPRVPERRVYESVVRERQAGETRLRIAAAARRLLQETGYAGMTIPAVAKAAGVAVPTVYSIFGSKKGIVTELLDAARFGDEFQDLRAAVMKVTDPLELLKYPPRFARKIYDAEIPVENLLRGAGMVAPELAAVEQERDCMRYDSQAMVIDSLERAKLLRPELTRERARAVLWAMTSREIYRMLVRTRGWIGDEYEEWLHRTLLWELTGR